MYNFAGKVAFITGAMGVVGKGYAKYLLKNKIMGIAHVDLNKPDEIYQQELEANFGKDNHIFIQIDVTNKIALKDAFETTVKHFGQLDIVINNAGTFNEDDYEITLQTNFMATMHGTMFAMQEYLPKYKKGPGVIVNTSSVIGVIPDQVIYDYSLSKHAICAIGLIYAGHTKCIEHDIRILTICPGATTSPLFLKATASYPRDPITKELSFAVAQCGDYLGEGLIKIINEGINGAVWIFVEGRESFIVDYKPVQDAVKIYLQD